MDWEAVSAVAESVGAIATVAMLVYLAIQIRHNSASLKSSAFHQANTLMVETLVTERDLVELGQKDWEECSRAEQAMLVNIMARRFTLYETMFYQHRDGGLESELWNSREFQIKYFANSPAGKAFWEERRIFFAESFRSHVDKLAAISGDA